MIPGTGSAAVALTDANGRFVLPVTGAGATVVATKTGYGRRVSPLTPPGGVVEIRLVHGAAISGRVVDEFGEPFSGARVTAESPPGNLVATTTTDDRGEYRLGSLNPADVIVAATTAGMVALVPERPGSSGSVAVRRQIYYPGVDSAAAALKLRLNPGDERAGVDIQVQAEIVQPPVPGVYPGGSGRAVQPDIQGNASVRGRVLATDGRPLPSTRVIAASAAGLPPRVTTTDQSGRYDFANLPAGPFRIVAVKPGYRGIDASSRSLDVAAGDRIDRVDLALERWSALGGHVLDENGEPVQSANVRLLQVRYEAGRRRLVGVAGPRQTDDLGAYRLANVAPGQYIVSADVGDVSSADLPGYTRSYFPGTAAAGEAQFVLIRAGQEAGSVDFALTQGRTARIMGQMLDASGRGTTGGAVSLAPSQHSSAATNLVAGARILPDGRFEFPSVAPGDYVIQAYRDRMGQFTEGDFGALRVTVADADVSGLVLQMSKGSTVTGYVTFDSYDRSRQPPRDTVRVTAAPVDPDLSATAVASDGMSPDGSFQLRGLNGPRRLELANVPPGWTLQQVLIDGVDVTDRPLPFGNDEQSLANVNVVLTDRLSEVAGSVADRNGRPGSSPVVIIFADDRDRWYPASRFIRRTTAGADGSFSVKGLPSGTYYAVAPAATPSDGADAWQDPQFLESLQPGASVITVTSGQRLTINLRVAAR